MPGNVPEGPLFRTIIGADRQHLRCGGSQEMGSASCTSISFSLRVSLKVLKKASACGRPTEGAPGRSPQANWTPAFLTQFGGEMLFQGPDANSHPQLWVTDGTSAGTSELSVANAGASGLDPIDLTVLGNKVLFDGTDRIGRHEIFM